MAQDSVERLLGRLITDDTFRKALNKDFDKICFAEGFNLSDSERMLIKKLNFEEFSQLSTVIDGRIRREGCG